MTHHDEVVQWCKKQQADLNEQLALLEAGKLKTHEVRGRAVVDTTKATMAQVRQWLTELNALLKQDGRLR